ncbi:DNA polymerase III, epsilon subunit [Rhodoferax ferrireducens T118]|uniref:DNA polymerase III subunit epsilon n=1 Tax=Albidiferax ferrireducens (strain ATCC BAA-621 / DSM 15236 / T118) TaxID=338969 RepID=Q21WE6_ALBFT|nr:DNA polymerase III subunit epsilon [Rhodoferax ferrireducens]ABD69907.1 DNA polymerase III, epsilon subunit [Rhodoferax ferrireducens T118]WPC65071.1 DNA polymerase III subunit epsilon [Rhodoferax ferrireducens]
MRQIFLDTETTGLSADTGDRIIEIGCVELFKRKLTGNNKHFYLNPGRESHEDALRVHGITSAFLKDKPKFEAVADELLAYVKDAEIIIHNAPFDLGFLNKELALLGRPRFKEFVGSVTDTLVMAKEMFPGKRNSLNALCDRLGVDNSGRALHGALLDAELLADVYINLTRGQDALLMEAGATESESLQVVQIDLGSIVLPVLAANDQESAAHDDVLNQIDKASGNKTVWRKSA